MYKLKIFKPKLFKLKISSSFPQINLGKLQEKNIEPTITEQIVTADENYDGLSKVTVEAVTNEIDNNIQPSNIKLGVSILGVEGNLIEDLDEEINTYDNYLTAQEENLVDIFKVLENKGVANVKYKPRHISFYGYKGTELVDELNNLDISNITSMNNMFARCNSLTNLDVSNFDTSNVTDMGSLFYNCRALTSLDLSNFDTSNVTDMSHMFGYCEDLTSLDVSNFNTNNVTTMTGMFQVCNSLTNLDVSKFNASKVTNMDSMFYGCNKLTNLDVSNFNASKVTDMSSMFYNCTSLISLDLSTIDTSNVTDMGSLFYNCRALTSLDIRNFDFGKVTSYTSIFKNIPAGCEIIVKDNTAKEWVLAVRNDFTNVKTVAEL